MVRRLGAALLATMVLGACGGDAGGSTPISEQDCRQLANTLADIQERLAPDQDFDTQAQAGKDAGELNDRVDALGGCPDEPDLQ